MVAILVGMLSLLPAPRTGCERARPGSLSVNVGRPKLLLINGQPNKTGIFKQPIEGRSSSATMRSPATPSSNREHHGGYDKAVYAYASEDYEWWSGELGRELAPGAFGENLTTSRASRSPRRGSASAGGSAPRCSRSRSRASRAASSARRWATSASSGASPRRCASAPTCGSSSRASVGAGDAIDVVERPDHEVTVGLLGRVLFEDSSLGPQVLAAGGAHRRLAGPRRAARRRPGQRATRISRRWPTSGSGRPGASVT